MAILRKQFDQALTNIEVNGDKAERAKAAHAEIRDILHADDQLGGSARHTEPPRPRPLAVFHGRHPDVKRDRRDPQS